MQTQAWRRTERSHMAAAASPDRAHRLLVVAMDFDFYRQALAFRCMAARAALQGRRG